ncbi:MAG: chemotaxis protein CheC [Candidatus Nitrosotalea sp.]|nr:chemotaxis protein CheC [Candidatus Nitrosotalea sp.]
MSTNYNDLQKLNSVLDSFIVHKTIPALGTMLGEIIMHSIKKTHEMSITNLDLIISDLEEMNVMSAVYIKCDGDLHMGALLYLPENESKTLASKLLGRTILNELEGITPSSISEIGNILTASIINAISDNTGYKIYSSVPGYAVEFFRTLLEAVVSDFGNESGALIVSHVEFHGLKSGIMVHMLLIQNPSEVKLMI